MDDIPVDPELLDLFEVDSNSPTGAVWAKDYRSNKKGEAFGYLFSNKRYWRQRFYGKQYSVHNLIWLKIHKSKPENLVIDHIDRNGLNNKIENLRLVSVLDNLQNRQTWSESGFRGVSYFKETKRYAAYIMYYEHKRIHLGYFKFKEHAAIAHDIAAIILYPNNKHYKLNFTEGFWLTEETFISNKVLEKIHIFFEK